MDALRLPNSSICAPRNGIAPNCEAVTITVDDWRILLANQQTGWAAQKQGASAGAAARAGQKLLGKDKINRKVEYDKAAKFHLGLGCDVIAATKKNKKIYKKQYFKLFSGIAQSALTRAAVRINTLLILTAGPRHVTDPDDRQKLDALSERIAAVKEVHEPKPSAPDHHSQAQLAWRMVIELVAGLGIGFGMGFGLDVLLGTTPWLMIIFVLLGFAAGIKTMMRSAAEIQSRQEAALADSNDSPQG